MRTKLANLKQILFDGVMDPSFKHFLSNNQTNQRAFIMAFFPLGFLKQEENQFIIEVRTNNSSRLSNIFNRITEPKRNEGRFRKRFIKAFDVDFYKEMVDSTTFFLRNHNHENFQHLIDTIIADDDEINKREHHFIKHYLLEHLDHSPEKTLAMLILWAFHIDAFDPIIQVIKEYEQFDNPMPILDAVDLKWQQLSEYLKTLNVRPEHIKDYMEIVKSYGISGQLGAIALHTYIETNIDVNPLIYSEVANNLYYGTHYAKKDSIKSLNYFNAAANTGFGQALWTMGQMTNHSRHQSNMKNAMISKEYYKRALSTGMPLSYNNLGILYHRALVFLLNRIAGYAELKDCFKHDSASGISEIYHSVKDEPFFLDLIEKFDLKNFNAYPATNEERYQALKIVEEAERYILDNYFIPGYEDHDYFYAAGSALTIYESQFNRYEKYYEDIHVPMISRPEYQRLMKQIINTSEYYSNYFCTECHYTYATIIERFEPDELQNAYEHYYIAAFETPHRAFRFHALVRFLELHFSSLIMNKKQEIEPLKKLLTILTGPLLPYNPETMLALRSMDLLTEHMAINLTSLLSGTELDNLKENLTKEMTSTGMDEDRYLVHLNNL